MLRKYRDEVLRPALVREEAAWFTAELRRLAPAPRARLCDLHLDEWPLSAAKGWAQLHLQDAISVYGQGFQPPAVCLFCDGACRPGVTHLLGECAPARALVEATVAEGPWATLPRVELAARWRAAVSSHDVDAALSVACVLCEAVAGRARGPRGRAVGPSESSASGNSDSS